MEFIKLNTDSFRIDSRNIEEVPGDGSCLYHCFIRSGYGDNVSMLRNNVANYMEANKKQFEKFVIGDWNEYMTLVRGNGWGDNLELHVIQEMFKEIFSLRVYRCDEYNRYFLVYKSNKSDTHLPKINLLHKGSHFNLWTKNSNLSKRNFNEESKQNSILEEYGLKYRKENSLNRNSLFCNHNINRNSLIPVVGSQYFSLDPLSDGIWF